MSHSITAKLNKAAREHANSSGVTFFVSLGEKNYDFKQKTNVWTNYDAALFAKDGQVDFYRSSLVEGAIVQVSGTGLILDISNTQYPKLSIQDAKLGFVNSPDGAQAPQQGGFAPQQQGGFQNQSQQQQAAPQQQGGFQNQSQFNQAPPQPQQQNQFAPQQQIAGQPVSKGFQQQPNDDEPPF